jgi:DNA-binding protein YbaB
MTTENMRSGMHPNVAQALEHLERFNSALEGQMRQTATGSFSATDESETVHVTLNGYRSLTGLRIDEGLLRLGADTVGSRINEALTKAQAAATETTESQQTDLVAALSEIANSLRACVSETSGRPAR